MKRDLLLLLVFCNMVANAQLDTVSKKAPFLPSIVVYIAGHPYENSVEASVFTNEFHLALSDTSYKIDRLMVTWDDGNAIYALPVKDHKVNLKNKKDYVSVLKPGDYVAFDHIHVKKNDSVYRVKAFVVTVTTAEKAKADRQYLAYCDVELVEPKHDKDPSATDLKNGFEIKLSDPGYSLLSYKISVDDVAKDTIVTAYLTDTKLRETNENVAVLLNAIHRGSVVIIQEVLAMKDGRAYRVRPFAIYVR